MSDELELEGKQYISSKRASLSSGYTQDYIGQLARKGQIDARRIGGLWYISLNALTTYKQQAENFKPEPPQREYKDDASALVLLDGKEYLSSGRAAEVTGYHSDYVGQLARSGAVESKQVGNRWYVNKESIKKHKVEKDALLAAVQTDSVGLKRTSRPQEVILENGLKYMPSGSGALLNYIKENDDLIPLVKSDMQETEGIVKNQVVKEAKSGVIYPIPLRKVRYTEIVPEKPAVMPIRPKASIIELPKASFWRSGALPVIVGGIATIVIVLSVGYTSVLKENSAYAVNLSNPEAFSQSLSANVLVAFSNLEGLIESLLTKQVTYTRN